MEVTTVHQTIQNMLISLGYAIATLIVSVITLYLVDHYLYRKIDFIEEIKKGNIAASIFYSVLLIFVAVIVTVAIN